MNLWSLYVVLQVDIFFVQSLPPPPPSPCLLFFLVMRVFGYSENEVKGRKYGL
jgi:hypothetical protein